jgi:outer membrane protein assembly factor BamB
MEPARSPACSQPAVAANGTSYWIGHGIYALTKDGVLLWAAEQREDFVFVSIAADGTVYALANGGIFAIAPDGKEDWKFPLTKTKYFTGAIAIGSDGMVYLTTLINSDSSVTLLTSGGDLKQRYRADSGETFVTGNTLIAADGTIYVTKNIMNRTYAMALDPSGHVTWTGPQESETLSIASDGTLCFYDARDLVAINPHGKVLWRARLPEDPNETEAHGPTKAVTLGPNGTFYIGDFVGRLGTLDSSVSIAPAGWPVRFHDARNTSRAGAH